MAQGQRRPDAAPGIGGAPPANVRAKNAELFFELLIGLLDTESDVVSNAETDLAMRSGIRRAVKTLKGMLASAQRFHSYRFSDEPERIENAAAEARRLVDAHNQCSRHDPNLELLKAITRIDERTLLQPTVFGRKSASVARASLSVILFHYVPLDDAFEDSASTSFWTKRAFSKLCKRLDQMRSLSFKTPVQQLVTEDCFSLPNRGSRSAAKRKRGRPTASDSDEQQILRLWRTRDYRSYKECADAVVSPQKSKIPLWKRVQRIVVRDNKRQSRARKAKNDRA